MRTSTMSEVMAVVAEEMDVPLEAMTSRARMKRWVEARHVAMAIAVKRTALTPTAIGKAMGGRDCSTVLHGIETIKTRQRVERDLADTLARIEDTLETMGSAKPRPAAIAERAAAQRAEAGERIVSRIVTRVADMTATLRDEARSRARMQLGAGVFEEMARLRKLGWSISGLARRYRLLEDTVADLLGEPWKVRA